MICDCVQTENNSPRHRACFGWPGVVRSEPLNGAKNDKPTDTLMARDEARHGKAFEGLLKRYFGK